MTLIGHTDSIRQVITIPKRRLESCSKDEARDTQVQYSYYRYSRTATWPAIQLTTPSRYGIRIWPIAISCRWFWFDWLSRIEQLDLADLGLSVHNERFKFLCLVAERLLDRMTQKVQQAVCWLRTHSRVGHDDHPARADHRQGRRIPKWRTQLKATS